MATRLIESLGMTEELSELFSDQAVIHAMLHFEIALARSQAKLGMIPAAAAETISKATGPDGFDVAALARDARSSASLAIPFVKALTDQVRELDEASAGFVHWGSTSQDLMDTTIILLLECARKVLSREQERLAAALRSLSDRHSGTVMLARTLLQPATPITFGYKVAGWLGAISRSWRKLSESFDAALVVQFGGASGTLAAFGDRGPELAAELGRELDLKVPAAPWHAHRDRLGALAAACGVYTACLGKMARDVTLLMQYEVGEVAEAGGSSSAMPHKRNPVSATIAIAAATRVPGLVSAYLTGMLQEHERAAGGWQAEWQTLTGIVTATASALNAAGNSIEGLSVFPDRMRANLDATHAAVYSEKLAMLLARELGRSRAQELSGALLREPHQTGRSLREILRANPNCKALLSPDEIQSIDSPEDYLGAAEIFRRRLLEDSE